MNLTDRVVAARARRVWRKALEPAAAALRERGVDGLLVCEATSGVDQAARSAGLPVCNIPCSGDLDLPFVWRLRRVLAEEKPDLVHCHSRRGGDFLGGQAAAMADVPAIVSRRVDNPESPMRARLRYRKFRKVVAISETIADVLRDAGLDQERLVIIRSAVDIGPLLKVPDKDAFRREFGIAGNSIVLGAIGQLIERKGHRFLLDAMATVVESHPQLQLLIFGEGPLAEDLRGQCQALGLAEKVRFAGFRDDLDEWIGCLDVVVHPALAEGLGVALLKAAAAAVPVVAFAAGGAREAVKDGETGLLVPPADVSGLGGAIATLVADRKMRERFGESGRERMQREFTVDAMVEKHVTLYETICSGQD